MLNNALAPTLTTKILTFKPMLDRFTKVRLSKLSLFSSMDIEFEWISICYLEETTFFEAEL